MIYTGIDDNIPVNSARYIATLVLLVMQIKYDITDIKTSPKVWYIKYTTQAMQQYHFYEQSVEEINRIVDLLGLPNFLKIIDNSVY